MKHKTIIVIGSSRPYGNTRTVVDYLISLAPHIDIISLSDYNFGYFDYEQKNNSDDFLPLVTLMLEYKTIVFATPIYWYTMSAQMKTFFDRISDLLIGDKKIIGRQLRGKQMATLSCGSDAEIFDGFTMPFVKSADYLDMAYLGHVHTWVLTDNKLSSEVKFNLKSFCDILK